MGSTIAIPASDAELLRRAKRNSTGFAELQEDSDLSPSERLYFLCIFLANEQRGYRDFEQIKRLAHRLGSDVDNTDAIARDAIERVDESRTRTDRFLKKLLALPPSQRRRAARKRGLDWPTTDEIQDRIESETFGAMGKGEQVVLVAPTASGKTGVVVETEWLELPEITGGEPVILFTETTDARDEAVKRAEDAGLDVTVLLGRHDACPVAAGDHDDELIIEGFPASKWFDFMIDDKGRSTTEVHREAEPSVLV